MVTAELAVGLAALVAVLVLLLSAISLASAQVRAQDAAREGARAAARGDDALARSLVAAAAPGATLTINRDGETVTATVRFPARLLARWLPAVSVAARAVAVAEPQARAGAPP